MAISNIFRTGSGTVPGSGFEFPAETIILSGEDLTAQGYQPLDEDLVLTQSQAPVLYDIYKSIESFILVAENNDFSNEVYESIEDLYFYTDNTNKRLVFSEDFSMLTDVQYFDYTHASNTDLKFLTTKNGIIYCYGTNLLEIIAFKLDLTQELTSDKIANINVVENIFTSSFDLNCFGISNNYFSTSSVLGVVKSYSLNNLTGVIDTNELNSINTSLTYSDPLNEINILQNDFIFNRGILTKIGTGDSVNTLPVYDCGINNMSFYKNGIDYLSYRILSSTGPEAYKTYKIFSDGTFEEFDFDEGQSYFPFYLVNENIFASCNANGALSSSNTGANHFVADLLNDQFYAKEDVIDIDASINRSFLDLSQVKNKNTYSNQVSEVNILVRSSTSNITNLVKVVDGNSETFTIEAIPSGSTDKKYWIFIE